MLIWLRTDSLSFLAYAPVRFGSQEAAIAEAMEIGILIIVLYFPEKIPHQTSISSGL